METTRLTKAGARFDILVSAALIVGTEGKEVGMVVSLTDITERKKMEAIGVLAGGIAHDFNNLLMVIQGNVSLALLSMDLNEGLRRHMETIEALVSRGATLTRQLLGFARGGSTRSRYTTSLIYSWEVIYYLSIDGGSMAGLPE